MSVHIQLASLASNDFLFPFLSSCFTNRKHPATQLFQKTQKQKHYSHFPIFSTAQDTTPTTEITPTTTIPTTTSTRKHVAIYLKERLGFNEEQSLTISKKLLHLRDVSNTHDYQVTDLISFEKADNVITFLQQHCGLTHSHVKEMVRKSPRILTADVDKTLSPKIKALQDMGFSTSDLAHVLSAKPTLMLSCSLVHAVKTLRDIMGNNNDNENDDYVVKVLTRVHFAGDKMIDSMITNVTMLENEFGVSKERVRKFLCHKPSVFMIKTEILREQIVKIEDKWGISRDSKEFLRALLVFCALSDDHINSKCQVYISFGWSESDVMALIKRMPGCFAYSEARLKRLLEFYMNELCYDPAYLVSRPTLFCYSLENRVVPRHRVLSILKEKEVVKPDFQLYASLMCNELEFVDKFIVPFENDLPQLRDAYGGVGGLDDKGDFD